MRKSAGFTIVELVVVVTLVGFLSAALVPPLQQANRLTNRTVCMSNLASIGKALVLYKGTNENAWPWFDNDIKKWDTSAVGTSRDKNPFKKAGKGLPRSITALPFLLVRDGQPVKLFACPSDRAASKDADIVQKGKADEDDPNYFYWDFSAARHISYSWQAPILDSKGTYRQGLSDRDNDAIVIADKTPAAVQPNWRPDDMSKADTPAAISRNVSPNHRGVQVNALYVGMNVSRSDRPDIGDRRDNIYTASGNARSGSRSATSLDIRDHLSTRDTFLIGPVAGKKAPPKAGPKGTL